MKLDDWAASGWVTPHNATPQEMDDLLDAAARDLVDARKDLSPGWRFAIAYNAALRLATAVLYGAGFRAAREQKHYRTLAALPLVLGSGVRDLAAGLDRCRVKRHDVTYESLASASQSEANELITAVAELEARVRDWLRGRRRRPPG